MKKIILGVTTYDRKNILLKMAQSLLCVENIDDVQVVIFDDASTEYDKLFLKNLFPMSTIFTNSETLGSDRNIYKMYEYFLETSGDIFVNADSDLIFNNRFVSIITSKLGLTDGVLSLYNSFKHEVFDTYALDNDLFLLKKTVGSAGVVFSRDVLSRIMQNVQCSGRFDWDWCDFLDKDGTRIMVTKNSYIQHIGYTGYNTDHAYDMDYGLNFIPGSELNCEILSGLLETVIVDSNVAFKERLHEAYWIKKQGLFGRVICLLLDIRKKLRSILLK